MPAERDCLPVTKKDLEALDCTDLEDTVVIGQGIVHDQVRPILSRDDAPAPCTGPEVYG